MIEEAAKLGMKLWIYDESNWPSGYAGGRVLARALEDWILELDGKTVRDGLGSWHELSLAGYSSTGIYRTAFEWSGPVALSSQVVLDLGHVFETARVKVNGCELEPMAWGPYCVEITPWVTPGRNELVVEVANTNANAFEGKERVSGHLGPVRLLTCGSDG